MRRARSGPLGLVAAGLAIAMFALQTFTAPAAMASTMNAQTVQVCTGAGFKTIRIGADTPAPDAPCPHCEQGCIAAHVAELAQPALTVRPAVFAGYVAFQPARLAAATAARAPPRPFSQGPPAFLKV